MFLNLTKQRNKKSFLEFYAIFALSSSIKTAISPDNFLRRLYMPKNHFIFYLNLSLCPIIVNELLTITIGIL